MQAGKTKVVRARSQAYRASLRPTERLARKEARGFERAKRNAQAIGWESIAKNYASPEHIAKTKAIHKQQCQSLAVSKAQ
jgi:hypothetical protein